MDVSHYFLDTSEQELPPQDSVGLLGQCKRFCLFCGLRLADPRLRSARRSNCMVGSEVRIHRKRERTRESVGRCVESTNEGALNIHVLGAVCKAFQT